MDINDGEGGNKITSPTSFASMGWPSAQALTPSWTNFSSPPAGTPGSQPHSRPARTRCSCAHACSRTSSPSSRPSCRGRGSPSSVLWGDVGLRVALEDPRGRPARSEVVADVVHGPALCGEREGELELWVCVWGMGSRRAMIKGSLPTNPTTPDRLRWWARPSDDDFKVF